MIGCWRWIRKLGTGCSGTPGNLMFRECLRAVCLTRVLGHQIQRRKSFAAAARGMWPRFLAEAPTSFQVRWSSLVSQRDAQTKLMVE